MSSKQEPQNTQCTKRFIKSHKILETLEVYHHIFTIIIWIIIVILLVDYYKHILPHHYHEGILWFEFASYTLFLFIPIIVIIYRKYKIHQCNKKQSMIVLEASKNSISDIKPIIPTKND